MRPTRARLTTATARVSSKGGTTLAVSTLGAMAHAGLQTTVAVGLAAAHRRAREMAIELAGS